MAHSLHQLSSKNLSIIFAVWGMTVFPARADEKPLEVGIAQVEITPPLGFPMAGYYHERLATGTLDPLWAKAIVFRQGEVQAGWVACDLTGVSIDLSTEVRRRVAERTGIPAAHLVVSATHSHTAPDYTKSLYQHLGPADAIKTDRERERAAAAGRLVEGIVTALTQAHANLAPATLMAGSVQQQTPVSFSRRFVMRDGSVQTWVGLKHPQAIRAANPIDPEIGLVKVLRTADDQPVGLLSNFALHLDTLGGSQWSGDYPSVIAETVRSKALPTAISLFGTGCCGDINHANPLGEPRLKTQEIGESLGTTIVSGLDSLTAIPGSPLQVRTEIVQLLLQEASPADIRQSLELVRSAQAGNKLEFFAHVTAYKRLVLDRLLHKEPVVDAADAISLGLTHVWGGIGETIPAEVTVISVGPDLAMVFLPGEVFVDLGMAIKKASPFRTTLVVELANAVETIYIPHRQAYAGGGYEVTNSLVQPGSGEMLVEAAVRLLRQSATQNVQQAAQ